MRATAIFADPCTGARKTVQVRRGLPTGHRSRPIRRGTRPPQVVGPQGAVGRSRRIGSVLEGYAISGRRPRVTLRSATLHFARPAACIPGTARERYRGEMSYYVYENWTHDRARIHKSNCGFCNDGAAKQSARSDRNGQWHGPFEREEAFAKASTLGCENVRPCPICDP